MACYNCEQTLPRAIESILSQTYKNWIMICCDDGSTDNSYAILCDYQKKHPTKFVILKNNENKQLPYSLNRCLKYVKTDFVARMDADDWSMPTRLEKEISYLKAHKKVDLLGTGIAVFENEKQISSNITPAHPTIYDMSRSHCFSHATIMTYKYVYDKLGGYSEEENVFRHEDTDLFFRFFINGFVGHNISEELYAVQYDHEFFRRGASFYFRLTSAKIRYYYYKQMKFNLIKCCIPYLCVLKAFIPSSLFRCLHFLKLRINSWLYK